MIRQLIVAGASLLLTACAPRQEAAVNVPMKTLGGRFYWEDIAIRRGWRVQRHVWTDHYRLLDTRDVRRAWGSRSHCLTQLDALKPWPKAGQDAHLVVLLPGIGCPRQRLQKMADAFTAAGCEVACVSMPSLHVDQDHLAGQVAGLLAEHRGAERLSFVTHSMGGLILRRLLDPANATRPDWPAWRERYGLHRAVMLFPPNRGAAKADAWHERWWYAYALGPAGQQLTSAAVRGMPPPTMPFAIIAGGKGDGHGRSSVIPGDDDGTVGVDETRLAGAAWLRVYPVGHTFGMQKPVVIDAAVQWIMEDTQLAQMDDHGVAHLSAPAP